MHSLIFGHPVNSHYLWVTKISGRYYSSFKKIWAFSLKRRFPIIFFLFISFYIFLIYFLLIKAVKNSWIGLMLLKMITIFIQIIKNYLLKCIIVFSRSHVNNHISMHMISTDMNYTNKNFYFFYKLIIYFCCAIENSSDSWTLDKQYRYVTF